MMTLNHLRLNKLRRPIKHKMNNLDYTVFLKLSVPHQTGTEVDNIIIQRFITSISSRLRLFWKEKQEKYLDNYFY